VHPLHEALTANARFRAVSAVPGRTTTTCTETLVAWQLLQLDHALARLSAVGFFALFT
jgi:hypothetical protein